MISKFYSCVSVHRNISQIKHQLDATLCRFISAASLYMFRASSAHHLEYYKTGTAAPGTGVIVAGRSSRHHIRDETPFRSFVPIMVTWWPTCNYNTCTRGGSASFLKFLMMGARRPKYVEWICRNKTCTVLHQVGVLFDWIPSCWTDWFETCQA